MLYTVQLPEIIAIYITFLCLSLGPPSAPVFRPLALLPESRVHPVGGLRPGVAHARKRRLQVAAGRGRGILLCAHRYELDIHASVWSGFGICNIRDRTICTR